MTDNEIIKCLRYCRAGDCENCKALNVCDATFSFHKEALDLINRQNAEIERLTKKVERLSEVISDSIRIRYKEAKSEAIKEFAEKLKSLSRWMVSDKFWIDKLVEEMTDENND